MTQSDRQETVKYKKNGTNTSYKKMIIFYINLTQVKVKRYIFGRVEA